jgi:hypothetical protein
MIQTGVIHYLQNRMDGACFWVIGSIHQTTDASMNCSSRAHGARLNCSKKFAVAEAVIAEGASGFAQSYYFSVSGGVAVGEIAIPSSSDNGPFGDHDCSYGDFACLQRTPGTAEGLFHPELVHSVGSSQTRTSILAANGYLWCGKFLSQLTVVILLKTEALRRNVRSNARVSDYIAYSYLHFLI